MAGEPKPRTDHLTVGLVLFTVSDRFADVSVAPPKVSVTVARKVQAPGLPS